MTTGDRSVAVEGVAQACRHRDRLTIDVLERLSRIAELLSPIGVRPPRRGIENKSDAALAGGSQIGFEIASETPPPGLVGHERKGREARQVDAFHEDQERLQPAIRQEHRISQLRQIVPITRHDPLPIAERTDARALLIDAAQPTRSPSGVRRPSHAPSGPAACATALIFTMARSWRRQPFQPISDATDRRAPIGRRASCCAGHCRLSPAKVRAEAKPA